MHFICPWLAGGPVFDTFDPQLLADQGIGAMLQLAIRKEQPGIPRLHLRVADRGPLPPVVIREGVDFVRDHKHLGHLVLIACAVGMNRSVTFAIATLKEEEGGSLLAILRDIQQTHRTALPHPELWQALCAYYQEDVPLPGYAPRQR